MKMNSHENEFVKGWSEGDVMFAEFKKPVMDLDAAKQSVALRLEAAGDKSYLCLIDARKVNSITKEARDYLASADGSKGILASALVLDSVIGKILGNFFLQISKPKVPLRLFTNKGDALEWLNTLQES